MAHDLARESMLNIFQVNASIESDNQHIHRFYQVKRMYQLALKLEKSPFLNKADVDTIQGILFLMKCFPDPKQDKAEKDLKSLLLDV